MTLTQWLGILLLAAVLIAALYGPIRDFGAWFVVSTLLVVLGGVALMGVAISLISGDLP